MPNLTSLSAKHSSSSWIAVMLVIFLSTSVGATDYLMLGTYSYTRANDYPMDVTSYTMAIIFLLTGALSLFRGNKYRWLSIVLGGFYTAGIMIALFVIKFQNVTDPSGGLRFIYLAISIASGVATGLFFVCMWPSGRVLVGAIGGHAFSFILLSTRTDGLIRSHIPRYIFMVLFIVLFGGAAGCKRIYPYVAIVSTVFTGAYLIMLGADIFARAGLLAGYKYLWGFTQPDDYRYTAEKDNGIILLTVGLVPPTADVDTSRSANRNDNGNRLSTGAGVGHARRESREILPWGMVSSTLAWTMGNRASYFGRANIGWDLRSIATTERSTYGGSNKE
ncbi:9740_t:CDS:2 [Paraglomus brasilianum]|uniref:9740_t:CDS:1 n=1 Tax=Paraglomus brasilianum TaxID=144538 RepID=A0A9N9AEV6_9GLOM|nr:9740_t:CDS:2 [Paraglomus brasilianum]